MKVLLGISFSHVNSIHEAVNKLCKNQYILNKVEYIEKLRGEKISIKKT